MRIVRPTKPLIIGEAPARTGDPRKPITGACGAKLAALAGLTEGEFRRRFARMNLLDRWPGAAPTKGARWDARAATMAARKARRRFINGRLVILLGWRVAATFRLTADICEYLQEYWLVRNGHILDARVVVVPHPSGVNRWYNDAGNVARMRAFMEDAWR